MRALSLLLIEFDTRERELIDGLVTMPPATLEGFTKIVGQVQELRRTREETKRLFRMKDDEEED